MSEYSKLIIDGKEAYQFPSTDLPLNLKLRIQNIDGDTAGAFAKSKIEIPATKNNKDIFQDCTALPFYIENNTGVQYVGIAKLVQDKKEDAYYSFDSGVFEVELILNNSTWINLLRGCKLRDLVDEVVTYDSAGIVAATVSDPDIRNYGFSWVKMYEWAKSRTVDEEDTDGSGAIVSRTLESPSLFETTPLYFIRPLIEAAINKVGYTINSSFLDSEMFKREVLSLWIPEKLPQEYSDDYLNIETYKDVINVTSTGVSMQPVPYDTMISVPDVGANPYSTVTFQYTAPAKGYYEITVKGTFDDTVSGVFNHVYIAKVEVISGALGTVPPIGFGTASSLVVPANFPTGQSRESTGVVYLDAGAVLQVTHGHVSDVDFDVVENFLEIKGEAEVSDGIDLPLKYLFRDWEFLPMLSDLALIYNLRFEVDEQTKVINIEPVNDYRYTQRGYTSGSQNNLTEVDEVRQGFLSTDIVDWSSKVDYRKDIKTLCKDIKGHLHYLYLEEETDTLNFVNTINDPKVYDVYYDLLDESYNQETQKKQTTFFRKIIHTFDTLARFPNNSTDGTIITQIESTITPQMPLVYPSDFNYPLDPTATKTDKDYIDYPVLMYFAGQRGGLDGYIEVAEAEGSFFVFPALFAVNYNDPTGLDPSLSFCDENNGNTDGIIKRYHSAELARYRNKIYLSLFVCLNSVELNNITFGQRIYINSKRYILKEIEIANPNTNDSVKVLLQLDDYASQDDLDRLLSSGISGVVQAI